MDCGELTKKDSPFFTDKLSACVGQQSCLIHDIHSEIPLGSNGPGCDISDQDSLFIQYDCKVDDDELTEKRHQALLAACVNVFASLTLLCVIAYRQGSISIEKREWDLQTVTASDYTLEVKLSKEQIAQMRNDIYQNSFEYYESDGLQLKLWFKKLLEERLKEISGKDDGRISDINFAYHNSWLINKLRERGDAIKYQQWDKLNEINRETTQRIHSQAPDSDGTEIMKLTTPKCAFVSIESEEAYNFLADQTRITIAGAESKVAEAPEPTNVIWENRDFDKNIRYTFLIYVIVAVGVVLFITFLATVKAKSMTNDLTGKYDDSINCSEMNKMYQLPQLEKLAADEWIDFYKNGGQDQGRQVQASLVCFCSDEYMENGNDAAEMDFKASDGTTVKTCSEFFADRA